MIQGTVRNLLWWVMAIAAVGCVWCVYRVWSVKLVLENDSLSIVDMFRRVLVNRAEVEGITSVATLFGHRYEYFLELTNGKSHRVSWMFSFFPPSYEKQLDLNQINAWAQDELA